MSAWVFKVMKDAYFVVFVSRLCHKGGNTFKGFQINCQKLWLKTHLLGYCLGIWVMSVIGFKARILVCLQARSAVCMIVN